MELDINSIGELVTLYGLRVLFALLIFFVGKLVAKKLSHVAAGMMRKSKLDDTLVHFAKDVLYALGLIVVVIAALNQLGIDTTHLAAVLAAAGLAIGLALQGSLSNLAAGIMIILFRPFRVGDFVEAGGTSGSVEQISIFTTNFTTPDNKHVIVPNNEITAGVIINYSAKQQRRIDLVIGVGYGDDLQKVKKVLTKIVESDERILKDPAPTIAVAELGDSSVNLVVRPWALTSDYWSVRFDLIENIKTTFDKEGISIPFPQRDLHIIDTPDSGKKEPKSTPKPKSKPKTPPKKAA